MPTKPKKPCAFPSCPNLTDERYCEDHKKKAGRLYEKYGRGYDAHQRYDSAWKKLRDRYIHMHPLCEECRSQGRFVAAEHVHHIVPLSDGGTHDEDNLKSLCKSCHSRIHLRERNRK